MTVGLCRIGKKMKRSVSILMTTFMMNGNTQGGVIEDVLDLKQNISFWTESFSGGKVDSALMCMHSFAQSLIINVYGK